MSIRVRFVPKRAGCYRAGLPPESSTGPAMISATENNTTGSVTATVWIGFAMMCIGMFMAILDVQVVATSLATIQEALNIAQDQMSWIQTSYLIAEIIAIPLTGFLTRLLTMRWLFVVAVSVFTFASIACAMSGNFSSLISWRIVQGFSGGTAHVRVWPRFEQNANGALENVSRPV